MSHTRWLLLGRHADECPRSHTSNFNRSLSSSKVGAPCACRAPVQDWPACSSYVGVTIHVESHWVAAGSPLSSSYCHAAVRTPASFAANYPDSSGCFPWYSTAQMIRRTRFSIPSPHRRLPSPLHTHSAPRRHTSIVARAGTSSHFPTHPFPCPWKAEKAIRHTCFPHTRSHRSQSHRYSNSSPTRRRLPPSPAGPRPSDMPASRTSWLADGLPRT